MRRRDFIASVITAATGFLSFGLVACDDKSTSSSLKKVSLRLSWIPSATFAGDYLGVQRGYWRDEGLDVSLAPGGFEFDSIKLVAAGRDTFGITTGPQLLKARDSGAPVVGIAVVIPDSPIGWVSRQSSGIVTPADFVGRKVGAQFGTLTEITFDAMMSKLGISLDHIDRVPIKFDYRAFVAGQIDVLPCFLIDQPIDLEMMGISLNIIDPRTYGVNLAPGNIYFTTEATLHTTPDIVKRFLKGAKRAWQTANLDRAEAVKAILPYAQGVTFESFQRRLDATFAFIGHSSGIYPGIWPFDLEKVRYTQTILVEYKELSKPLAVDAAFNSEFVSV